MFYMYTFPRCVYYHMGLTIQKPRYRIYVTIHARNVPSQKAITLLNITPGMYIFLYVNDVLRQALYVPTRTM